MATESTLQSAGNYLLSYLGVCDALLKEQSYLEGVSQSQLLPESERAMAAVVAATIGIKLVEMSSRHELFMQRLQGQTNPPSDSDIKDAVALSKRLAVDIRAAATASAVLTIVTQFVTAWTEVVKA
jgi:hypothetical protein